MCQDYSVHDLINPQQFNQHDEDTDTEIEIVCGFGAHGGGKGQAALAQRQDQRALALQDKIRNPPVACGDHQAKKKSRNLEWHIFHNRMRRDRAQ